MTAMTGRPSGPVPLVTKRRCPALTLHSTLRSSPTCRRVALAARTKRSTVGSASRDELSAGSAWEGPAIVAFLLRGGPDGGRSGCHQRIHTGLDEHLADRFEGYRAHCEAQPLAAPPRRTYAGRVGGYLAWLAELDPRRTPPAGRPVPARQCPCSAEVFPGR